MKLKYRLQTVVDVRERAKEEAARFVAVRRQQLADAEIELIKREEAVENCRREQAEARKSMLAEMEKGTQATKIVARRFHLDDLKKLEATLQNAVEQQKKTVERAALEVENAVAKLIEAAKEAKAIETHKENWQTVQKHQIEKREQKLNDEIGAILYERRPKH